MIITQDSHLDHQGLTIGHLVHILGLFKDRYGFFKETITLPPNLPRLMCGLYGPSMGDEDVPDDAVEDLARSPRTWTSRILKSSTGLMARPTSVITVVAGPDDKHNPCVLYTIYGGPQAPREPGDPSIFATVEFGTSVLFWKKHALVKE